MQLGVIGDLRLGVLAEVLNCMMEINFSVVLEVEIACVRLLFGSFHHLFHHDLREVRVENAIAEDLPEVARLHVGVLVESQLGRDLSSLVLVLLGLASIIFVGEVQAFLFCRAGFRR